jgi:hypothetical protein
MHVSTNRCWRTVSFWLNCPKSIGSDPGLRWRNIARPTTKSTGFESALSEFQSRRGWEKTSPNIDVLSQSSRSRPATFEKSPKLWRPGLRIRDWRDWEANFNSWHHETSVHT